MKILLENWRRFLAENESKYFPWIDDLLGCWLNMGPSSGAGFVLTRECCEQTPLTSFSNPARNLMDPPPYDTM